MVPLSSPPKDPNNISIVIPLRNYMNWNFIHSDYFQSTNIYFILNKNKSQLNFYFIFIWKYV